MKLNLYLDKPNSTTTTTVMHSIHYKGERIKISSGISIEPVFWDKAKGKQIIKRTKSNFAELNRELKKQKNAIEKIVLDLTDSGRAVSKENITVLLTWTDKLEAKEAAPIAIFRLFLIDRSKELKPNSIKTYKTTLKHLIAYEKHIGSGLSFHFFTKDFGQTFFNYLLNEGKVFDNMASKVTAQLKTFLTWAVDKGWHKTEFYKDWKIKKETGKAVFFLKFKEVQQVAAKQFEPRLERIKTLFLIGCYTGLRYSDIITLRSSHIADGVIKKTIKKTSGLVTIPIIPELQTILEICFDANGKLPFITNAKGNEYIHELIKMVGFDWPFNYVQKKNGTAIEKTYLAWEMCSFHTARHSFATIAMQRGIPLEVIRQILGHSDYKILMAYIQNDPDFNKVEMMKMSNSK